MTQQQHPDANQAGEFPPLDKGGPGPAPAQHTSTFSIYPPACISVLHACTTAAAGSRVCVCVCAGCVGRHGGVSVCALRCALLPPALASLVFDVMRVGRWAGQYLMMPTLT
ncbi:hypothetical protein PLESTM_001560500 [Pleodorina starrii]|nr:hypothetical protein PLESTM_001560500 [Pleodorina starrii]